MFLAPKHFRIKTQKYTFGGQGNFISQGLLMTPEDFGWKVEEKNYGKTVITPHNEFNLNNNSRWLTKELGVIYSTTEDNKRGEKLKEAKENFQLSISIIEKISELLSPV